MTIGLVTGRAFCDPLQLPMEMKQGIRKHAGMVNDDSRSHDLDWLDWEGTSAGCKSQNQPKEPATRASGRRLRRAADGRCTQMMVSDMSRHVEQDEGFELPQSGLQNARIRF